MSSPHADLRGAQQPRVSSSPPFVSSAGQEAIELAAMAGLELDPWQQHALDVACRERADGKWAAFEVAAVVGRQNGKGAIIEARTLAGLILFNDRLILHSAHEVKTATDGFRRIRELIESTPDLDQLVQRVSMSRGDEGIEFKGGQRLRFVARTRGSGRGFSADLVILDEAYDLPDEAMAALLPTVSARSKTGNPQIWYTSSAVNRDIHPNGWTLSRLRARGIKGDDPALAYMEWSVDSDLYEDDPQAVAADPQQWAIANPGLGYRITGEAIMREHLTLSASNFATERLSVGKWPDPLGGERVIAAATWELLEDLESQIVGTPSFCIDVAPDRTSAVIGTAGDRADGKSHVETVAHMAGTGWIVDRASELHQSHGGVFAIDPSSPAGSLIPALEAAGVPLHLMRTRDVTQAFGVFLDACANDQLRHIGQTSLNDALAGAKRREVSGGGGAWARKSNAVDIGPVVAATNALWLAGSSAGQVGDPEIYFL